MHLEKLVAVLPSLKRELRENGEPTSMANLKKKAIAYINGEPLVDESGTEIDIESIDLVAVLPEENAMEEPTEEPAMEEPTEEPKMAEEGEYAKAEGEMYEDEQKPKAKKTADPRPVPTPPAQPSRKSTQAPYQIGVRIRETPRGIKSVVVDRPGLNKVTSFTTDEIGTCNQKAKAFGYWVISGVGSPEQRQKASRWLEKHGIITKAQALYPDWSGGALVPEEFIPDLISLREEFGVFRRNAKTYRMSSDTLNVPKRATNAFVSFSGEGQELTETSSTFERVTLVAKKIGALVPLTSEIMEDAAIDIGNDLMNTLAWSVSEFEDNCGFNGDGTSPYGGIVGVIPRIQNDGTVSRYFAGGTSSSGRDTWDEIEIGDFSAVMGLLPAYVSRARDVKWYCSQAFYGSVMLRLQSEGGGNTIQTLSQGATSKTFLGYPVEIVQVMPATTAVTQISCLFGSLSMAAVFGDRLGFQIASSDQYRFATDQVMIRATSRFDINVHSVDTPPRTSGGSATAGPIVALSTSTT